MKLFIVAIILNLSFHAQSQLSDCNSSGLIDGILACINTNPELKSRYGYKKIISYSAENKLDDYKKSKYYTVYQYIDSTHSVSSKSYRNGKLTPHEHFSYFDDNNNLIKKVSRDSSKVRYSYRSQNYVVDYIYKNNLLTKKTKYEDGQFFEEYDYKYNLQGLLAEVYRRNSNRGVLIQKKIYNKRNLVDTVYGYSFDGGQNSWHAYKYDSIGNIIEDIQFLSGINQIRKSTYYYIYDNQWRIIDKTIKDSDKENKLFNWKYIYETVMIGLNTQGNDYFRNLQVNSNKLTNYF